MDGDAKLIQQFAVGCPRALERVIELHGERLRRTIGQLTAWSPDVDDLLQETLVRAWKGAKSYREDGPLDKWLVSIAFRVCRDHQRGLQRIFEKLNRLWSDRQQQMSAAFSPSESEKWDHVQQAVSTNVLKAMLLRGAEKLENK